MTRLYVSIVVAMVAVSPAAAMAHPGHGQTPPESVLHFFLEPVHAVVIIAAAAGIAIAFRLLRKKPDRDSSP